MKRFWIRNWVIRLVVDRADRGVEREEKGLRGGGQRGEEGEEGQVGEGEEGEEVGLIRAWEQGYSRGECRLSSALAVYASSGYHQQIPQDSGQPISPLESGKQLGSG